ncbi:hypothetical protein MRY87_00525 [bacterium]|nr:hypothetical protein [bacterium]
MAFTEESLSLLSELSFLFALCLLPIHGIGQRALGRLVLVFLLEAEEDGNQRSATKFGGTVEYVTGLLVYLLALLVTKSVGVPWWGATFLPYFPLGVVCFSSSLYRPVFSGVHRISGKGKDEQEFLWKFPALSVNHAVWLAVHGVLGITLFDTAGGEISTPWKNNYGDLPFHIGMISSFTWTENFPPMQFIFSGSALSYPFLINLWTASLWHWSPSYYLLFLIFAFQWIILWEILYRVFGGDRNWAMPWLVLLGGGTFFTLGENSGQLISQGYGYTTFLSTIWVPQRSALFGIAVASVTLSLFLHWQKHGGRNSLRVAGFLLGLSPLVHTHICLVAGVFILASLSLSYCTEQRCFREWREDLFSFLGYACLALHAAPFLLEKHSLLSWNAQGFLPRSSDLEFMELLMLGGKNLLAPLLLLLVLFFLSQRRSNVVLLSALAVLFWKLRLSVWEWDQFKPLLGIVLIALLLLRDVVCRRRVLLFFLFPLLTLPSLYETGALLLQRQKYVVFDREKVILARHLQETLPKQAILAAAPIHNSPAVLTGRQLYVGYTGWLWSHGYSYESRLQRMKALTPCSAESICPTHLLWTAEERRFWNRATPPARGLIPLSSTLFRFPHKPNQTGVRHP